MSTMNVRVYIEQMKSAIGVKTDQELADKLGLKKQSISNWRRRDSIPKEIILKMTGAFGPEFTVNSPTFDLVSTQQKWILDACALIIVERWTSEIQRPFHTFYSPLLGSVMSSIKESLKPEIRKIGFELENVETMVEILTSNSFVLNNQSLKDIRLQFEIKKLKILGRINDLNNFRNGSQ